MDKKSIKIAKIIHKHLPATKGFGTKREKLRTELHKDIMAFSDLLINSTREECAMIFESQISDDNTDSANIDLKISAKAIRDSKC